MELKVQLGNMTGDVQKDLKTLSSFVFQQSEELRYLLHNLDVTNFNDLGLMRYENGRLQVYTEEFNIRAEALKAEFKAANEEMKTTIEGTINGLKSTVAANTNSITEINNTTIPGIQGQISTISQTAGQIQSTVSAHTTSINNINNTSIPALQSQITQQANNISLVVNQNGIKAAEIVAAINEAGSYVQISADHVNITGFVTFTDLSTKGSTVIDAGNVSTGTMEGVVIRSAGDWNVEIFKGIIYFGDYGTLAEHDDAILTFGTGNTYRFYLPNGRYWELSGSGMNYYTANGAYVNGFQFAN
jgi:hypothetical protein